MESIGIFVVYTQHFCAKCGSDQIRRNGHSRGHACYQCNVCVCRYQARFEPAAVAKAARYEQVDKLLEERNSQRSIVRVTGISRMSIVKCIKKGSRSSSPITAVALEKGAEKTVGGARTR